MSEIKIDKMIRVDEQYAFTKELESIINKHSMENGSDTPDFLLAEMLSEVLSVFDKITKKRHEWWNKGKLNPSEAIYGFCAWLTCREEVTKMGSSEDCAPIPPLIEQFCKANDFDSTRDGWHDNLNHPT